MSRLISMTVGTKQPEEWFQTFQELSELAANLVVSHHYVTISSIDSDECDNEDTSEQLYHNDDTLVKVRTIFKKFLDDVEIDVAMSVLQNAGIVFCERRKN